jgi:hypothetical protein
MQLREIAEFITRLCSGVEQYGRSGIPLYIRGDVMTWLQLAQGGMRSGADPHLKRREVLDPRLTSLCLGSFTGISSFL